jgi:hypothetical protein
MTTTLNWFKNLLTTALYFAMLVFLIWNLPAIATAGHTLLERAGSINTIEVEGVKIGFDQASVTAHLDAFSYLTQADKTEVFDKLQSLEPDEFERLMHVGELANLCEFEHPTVEMRRMSTLDYQLKDKGLTSITDSRHLRAEIEDEIKTGEVSSGKASDIGYPRNCYFMRLTDTGLNAKTALVKILSRAFDPRVASK